MSDEIKRIANSYQEGVYIEGDPEDPYSSGWIAGTGDIVSEATGSLREMALARAGREDGTVTIVEKHWDSGYCVTCSFEEVTFEIQINGETVWGTPEYNLPGDSTPFGALQAWLTGVEDD